MTTDTVTRRYGDTVNLLLEYSPRLRVTASPSRLLRILCLLSCTANIAYGISDNAGTSNGAFLKLATDARGAALGPTIVSMAEGTEGMRWNPGAIGMTETNEFATTHIQYYQGVSIENASFVYPMDDSAVAANLFYLSPGTLEGRDTLGNPTGDFQFYDLVGSVGYGRRLKGKDALGLPVYVGAALKVVQEQIAETQTQNPALDLGVLALPIENLRAGLSVQNLSAGGKANFPKQVTGGASYTLLRLATLGAAVSYADDAPIRCSFAGEYIFPELEGAVVRAGYTTHDALDDSTDSNIPAFRGASLAGLTMGAGFEIHPAMFRTLRFQVDYAMAPFGALGIAHTITVKLKW